MHICFSLLFSLEEGKNLEIGLFGLNLNTVYIYTQVLLEQ